MKTIMETALTHLLAAHPHATIEDRDGTRVVVVPMYDMDEDKTWNEERQIVPDPQTLKPGQLPTLRVRTGAKFNPLGDVFKSPLGHLFRIVDPPKDDKS